MNIFGLEMLPFCTIVIFGHVTEGSLVPHYTHEVIYLIFSVYSGIKGAPADLKVLSLTTYS